MTGHGFGHAVRVGQVLERLCAGRQDLEIRVRTEAPPWLFPAGVSVERCEADVGLAQRSGLEVDLEESLSRLDAFALEWPDRVRAEAGRLREAGARAVLGDVPPLAFAAAAEAGIPAVALANFSWDWIYRDLAELDRRFEPHAERAAEAYGLAEECLRLPFHGDLSAFLRVRDVPLIARRVGLSRAEARARLGLPVERPLVLLSFGGFGFRDFPVARLAEIPDVTFLATETYDDRPENLLVLERSGLDYDRLLRACDCVVTKPGYGITASSLVNEVRVLYTSRGRFAEFDVLARALEEHGTAAFVPLDRLAEGELRGPLEALLSRPVRRPSFPADGADRVAERIGELL